MTDDLKFTAEDFRDYSDPSLDCVDAWSAEACAKRANAILAAKLEKAVEVACGYDDESGEFEWYGKGSDPGTHRARLVCIEKLEGK